ncbi:MAG: DUF1173 family protein [Fimbriimonadaceae bacterium]
MATYLVADREWSPDAEGFQDALAKLPTPRRIQCLCQDPPVEMYVPLRHGAYRVACMPGTDVQHHQDCTHYDLPLSLSGAGQLMGSAIDENEDGDVVLRLDFALNKIAGRAPPPPSSGGVVETAKADPSKLTLRGLLHYLWQEAGFHKWTPRMEGKRTEGVFYKYLKLAGANKRMKTGLLADVLVVPRPALQGATQDAGELTLTRASTDEKNNRRLALVCGEVAALEQRPLGFQVRLKSMADPLQISAELYKKVEKAFGPQLSMWDPVGSKLIVLATYWIDQVGMAMVSEITLVNTNANYLPFETNFEKKLLDELMLGKRRFTKCLRFNLKVSIPIASVVLTDTDTPVAMFIQLPGIDLDTFEAKIDEVASLGMKTWVWRAGQARMPDLPPVGSRPGIPQ